MLGFGGKIKGASNVIGVAVTAKDVCLVQQVSSGYVFEHEPLLGNVAITEPNYHTESQRAISTALRRGKFAGKQAVSALPAEMLRYKTLRLPPMPAEDIAQAVAKSSVTGIDYVVFPGFDKNTPKMPTQTT